MSNPTFERIESDLIGNDIVLYMKGTKDMPMCGFSGAVVMILTKLGVEFKDINILEDEELRQGIKEYTNWPTIPQLYVKKEFIGGCDIVKEMFLSGELIQLLSKYNINFKAQ
ncbi:MAG: Grx4 family monothiol glutaredoxin [Alphaproteobacteria bacterium]|jgi:monothiol glutaredoxin|nr:Grx4 family monothiol glutaredoxin [Candidatus Jidaibacter sp.]